MVDTSRCYEKQVITGNRYLEAELSLFTLNAGIELGLMLKKLRDWSGQLSRYLGKNSSGRGKTQSRCPTVE